MLKSVTGERLEPDQVRYHDASPGDMFQDGQGLHYFRCYDGLVCMETAKFWPTAALESLSRHVVLPKGTKITFEVR